MKRVLGLVTGVAVLAALSGCGTGSNGASNTSSNATSGSTAIANAGAAVAGTLQSKISPNEDYIAVCAYNDLEYFSALKYQWKQDAKLFNVKTEWVGPSNGDINQMISSFQSAIAKKPAGIAVWGFSPALKPSIDTAMKQGIPVVTIVGDVNGSQRVSYVGSSQYDVGLTGGTKYAQSIGGKGKVAILTLPGTPMFDDRVAGFKAAFSKYPGIKVVAEGNTKADSVTAINAAKAIMLAHPDLTAFVCTDSTGALGAATAVAEAHKKGQVDIIGMDRNADILQKVKDGEITGSIVQDDVGISYWAMLALVSAKHVNIPLTSNNSAASAVTIPENIFTPINFVDKSNVDYYLNEDKVYSK